jgi:hypothetical protein
LGKVIKKDFKLYEELINKAKANINIFLDADAKDTAMKTYSLLNHGNLYGRIRIINSSGDLDPSQIYQKYGTFGIVEYLKRAKIDNSIIF